jgi:hypothetical protein
MPKAPRRIPGERNPRPDADAPKQVARESWMGGHDYGIARGILALVDWRKRRRIEKNR